MFINQNHNLKIIEALIKLRSVTEAFIVQDNPKLSQAQAEAAVACVSVGGKRVIEGNGL